MIFGQQLNTLRKFKRLARALSRLRIFADWSEALPVANTTLLEILCHGSFHFQMMLYCKQCKFCSAKGYLNIYVFNVALRRSFVKVDLFYQSHICTVTYIRVTGHTNEIPILSSTSSIRHLTQVKKGNSITFIYTICIYQAGNTCILIYCCSINQK